MREFKKRRTQGHEIPRFVLVVGGFLITLVLAFVAVRAAWEMYTKFATASQGAQVAKNELSQLESQHARVSAAVEDLSTPRGIEGEIRERFGVAKPGEGEIQIVRNASSTKNGENDGNENFFVQIFRSLFMW